MVDYQSEHPPYVIRSHVTHHTWRHAFHHTTSRLGRKREILLHPKSIPRLAELGDHTMGCRTSASPVIRSVHHHDYSVYPSVPEFRFPLRFMFPIFILFHVSVLIHIFRSVLISILKPQPQPWHMPDSRYPDMFSLVLIRSDPHVCSSVWNQHWLSLELTVWTSEPSSVSHPKFEDSRRLVAQHISWSQVLAENIEPRYALGPSLAHNTIELPIWFTSGETLVLWFLLTSLDNSCTVVLRHNWPDIISWLTGYWVKSLSAQTQTNCYAPSHIPGSGRALDLEQVLLWSNRRFGNDFIIKDRSQTKMTRREDIQRHQIYVHIGYSLLKFGDDSNTVWFVVVFCLFCVRFCSVLCKQKRSYSLGRWLSAP